ncbi:hypothetical protein [Streptomyces sp. NPDC047000]|uniref:type II toxin-antitoxin system RelE family toxin n=1 Tax=Streptomyces sp. NPDC047000 TaxID=3155474 RepID=UPI0033FB7259
MSGAKVMLRLLDKADKEILRLPRTVKGALFDFQHKFKENPRTPGLRLKQLKGDSRLWSARVSDEYRAILLRLSDDDWLIVSVKHRKDVYDRLSYGINQITGGIEYVDLQVVEDSVLRRVARPGPPAAAPAEPVAPPARPCRPPGTAVRRLVGRAADGTRRRRTAGAGHPQPHHRGTAPRADRVRPSAHRRGAGRALRRQVLRDGP